MLFTKYENNPVFGGKETGTTFDAYVSKQDKMLRMDFSYREKRSCAVVFGTDGINWSEPIITLSPNPESGWENDINRNCVLYVDGVYKMWYTGQANGHSRIGCAESDDGLNFVRKQSEPVIDLEYPWEGESVMNPCVIYENGLYRMWYSREMLKDWGWQKERGGYERGKDYNHSTFCDLVISDLGGVRVKNGNVEFHPMIPDDWDYFLLDRLYICGNCYRMVYDKTGAKYGQIGWKFYKDGMECKFNDFL